MCFPILPLPIDGKVQTGFFFFALSRLIVKTINYYIKKNTMGSELVLLTQTEITICTEKCGKKPPLLLI